MWLIDQLYIELGFGRKKKESSENGWFMKKVKELNKTQQLASHKSWNEILEAAAA